MLERPIEHKGWKIPETTLVFPWIVRLFPEIKYIFWIRNPRDCILGGHLTDDLNDFGIPYPPTEDMRLRRAISWKYQYDLVQACPNRNTGSRCASRISSSTRMKPWPAWKRFLGIPLAKIDSAPRNRRTAGR